MNLLDLEVGARDYEGEAAESGRRLAGLGVTEEHRMPQRAPAPDLPTGGLLSSAPQMPKTRGEQEYETNPIAATLKQMLIPRPIYHSMYGKNSEYTEQLAQYKVNSKLYEEQQAQAEAARVFRGHYDNLNDDIEGPEDARARAAFLGLDGVDSPEDANWVLKGGEPKVKPNYVTVDNNGEKYFMDSNNPNSPGIPMTTPEGKPIRSALTQAQVDNIGSFDRMVPRLQQLDRLEQEGMRIPRSTMTQLRAYEEADGSGQRVLFARGWQAWLEENLSTEQREYILAAEDAGMIVLRDESGAAISSGEILRQMNQYIMFDDLDEDGLTAQRKTRARKAETLMIGVPDYIKTKRSDNISYLEDFTGRLQPYPVPSTAAIKHLQNNPDLKDFFVEKYGKDALPEGI